MRAELFKDIINDSDDEDIGGTARDKNRKSSRKKKEQKRITPNYKIESIQYEGGNGTQSSSDEKQFEGGGDDLYNPNDYMQMYHTKQERGSRKTSGYRGNRSPQHKQSFANAKQGDMLSQYKQMFVQQNKQSSVSPTKLYGQKTRKVSG